MQHTRDQHPENTVTLTITGQESQAPQTDNLPLWEDIGEIEDTSQERLDHTSETNFPQATQDQIALLDHKTDIELCKRVRQGGYPNRWGARIPIETHWNVELFDKLLTGYHDRDLIEWMKYGWPIGRLPTMKDPTPTFKNHQSATEYPEALEKYIKKEQSYGAIIGPLEAIPFTEKMGVSPLSTRPKKDSPDRRIILDLSYPPGESVNDGIIKNNYLGFTITLSFPRTDEFALRIYKLGKGALMYKIDLHRYFRQLNLDPGDYSLVGYIVGSKLYYDKMVPMVVRTGPYIAQRVSSAITWIVQQMEYFLLNYVDDFVGAEQGQKAWAAYEFLTTILRDLKSTNLTRKKGPTHHKAGLPRHNLRLRKDDHGSSPQKDRRS